MKKLKRTIAGVSALALAMSMTACGGDSESSSADGTTEAQTTTTAATVEVNTATLAEEDQSTLDAAADEYLKDVELENKTIKWLAHYDINPSSSGASESVALNLFKTKYGGEIQWYPTTWDTRYSDLSTYVLGGEGIDFFPNDTAALPKGVVSGMFQPVDDYIDLSDPLWVDMQSAMDVYYFSGKHYAIATSVSAENIIYYNTQTIEEQGFDDPWELYEAGEWNWDTFQDMLLEFVDPDADQWGLDGWWYQKAIYSSAGSPAISVDDEGNLVSNLYDAKLEKAMNFGYSLYTNGLIMDLSIFDWSEQPQYLGEGKELFYICGLYSIQADPATWATGLTPDNVGIVPVPSPADSDAAYVAATIDSWVICKGADNPEGVALYADCQRLANTNDDALAIGDQKCIDDYQWSEELLAKSKEINALAQANPVVDLATGVSTDVASLTTDGGDTVGLRAAFTGTDWATTRDSIADVVAELVDEVDQQIKALG
ncbi:MAG: hypothetical protein LIO69_05535 [Oscillospiraceae bacterium]|nr:hypothetical protein [Oscillospiraceae bacterium]